ncbi:MAG: hypothetical protein K6C11_04480 [Bacilli bacterium]|nr:hypothetical protein [Bacilli bacterium]
MNNETDVKVVTKTLNVGAAQPIAVSAEDAMKIARAQNANNHEADIQLEETKSIDTVMDEVQTNNMINNNLNVNNAEQYNQQVNLEKLNEVNDLVKVEKVSKDNPKVVFALILVLAIIILGFFIFELPLIIDMLK